FSLHIFPNWSLLKLHLITVSFLVSSFSHSTKEIAYGSVAGEPIQFMGL
ncbi:hypothetical protein DBR06_SOUSAS3810021, partial [Sousa chinensis]